METSNNMKPNAPLVNAALALETTFNTEIAHHLPESKALLSHQFRELLQTISNPDKNENISNATKRLKQVVDHYKAAEA